MNSVVIIIPDATKATANKTAWALGFQDEAGDSFAMPASADGSAPATHWYARGQASPTASAILQAAKAGQIPTTPMSGGAWSDYGLTVSDLQGFAAGLIVDLRPYTADFDAAQHMADALAANGLRPVVVDPTP